MTGKGGADGLPDEGIEFLCGDELGDGEFADRNDEPRSEELDFALQPGGAILNFIWRRHAVTASGFFAGETAADGGHVDGGTKGFLGHAGGIMEPAEQGFAGRPGKGASKDRFLVARRLAD